MHSLTPRRISAPARSALLLAVVLSLATMAMPLAFVAACSCVGFAGPEESIAAAELAFVGSAVEAAPGGADPGMGMGTVRYAFEVERASAPTDAVIEVQALDDPGGAACGFSFGMGERWLVMAHRQDGALQTNLCSGNMLLTQLDEGDLDRVMSALPATPDPPADAQSAPGQPATLLPVLVGGLAALGLVAVMLVAFRGDRLR